MESKTLTDEINRRLAQANLATPGPWEKNGTGAYVAMMSIIDDRIVKYVSAPQTGICLSEGDTDFIASARTDYPAALKALAVAVEQLQATHFYCGTQTCHACEAEKKIFELMGVEK